MSPVANSTTQFLSSAAVHHGGLKLSRGPRREPLITTQCASNLFLRAGKMHYQVKVWTILLSCRGGVRLLRFTDVLLPWLQKQLLG